MDRYDLAMPAFRAAVSLMREITRNFEIASGNSPYAHNLVKMLDTASNQCEALLDHLDDKTRVDSR